MGRAVAFTGVAILLIASCVEGDNPYLCEDPLCGDAGPGDGGDGGDGGCTELWSCGYWQPTDAGTATRVCADLNGCGTTDLRPSEGPMPLPALNFNYFQCRVQPALAKSCAMVGCHGTLNKDDRPFRVLARGRQRNDEVVPYNPGNYGCGAGSTININLAVEASGTASCPAKIKLTPMEWAMNFDQARVFAIGGAASSELLSQPTTGTSFAHANVKPWSTASAEYQTVLSWLGGATQASCDAGFN